MDQISESMSSISLIAKNASNPIDFVKNFPGGFVPLPPPGLRPWTPLGAAPPETLPLGVATAVHFARLPPPCSKTVTSALIYPVTSNSYCFR